MFNFFGLNSILGVDIGTASIKIVEISKSSPKPKLKNYGVLKGYSHLEMPQMSDVDMAKTMPFQISQNIPVPVSEAAIEWLKIGERETEEGVKQQILIILIPKEIIGKYKTIFKLAGLKLLSVESESLSLVRALIDGDPTSTLLLISAAIQRTSRLAT